MVARFTKCDRRRLSEVLSRAASEHVEAEVAEHLQTCESCRSELELLAGGSEWWSDVRSFLSSVDEGCEDRGSSVRDGAPGGPEKSGWSNQLGFLTPSENADSLGRIGGYEVSSVIGRGGMGIVLKAFDPALNRHVAVKVLAAEYAHSGAARRRFAREARAAAAVVHDHVVPIYSIAADGDVPYLVMAWIPGHSLQERIDRTGPLELKEILRIGTQTAAGLAAAHSQGLVHRDIKPANILLEDSLERVRITDFGLARAVDDVSQTQSGILAGTPQYMSPEQAAGEPVDHRTDLFSLGSVLYAMCTGRSPFRAETTVAVIRRICDGAARPVREVNPEVPEWLAEIIEKLHAKGPLDRFQTAAEVAQLLEHRLAELQNPQPASRPVRAPQSARPSGSKRSLFRSIALGCGLALAVGLLAFSCWPRQPSAENADTAREVQDRAHAGGSAGSNLVGTAAETAPKPALAGAPKTTPVPVIRNVAPGSSAQADGRSIESELSRIRNDLDELSEGIFACEEPGPGSHSVLVREIELRLEILEHEFEKPHDGETNRR